MCWQDQALSETYTGFLHCLFLDSGGLLGVFPISWLVSASLWFSVLCQCDFTRLSSYKETSHIRLGPTLLQYDLIFTHHVYKDPVSERQHSEVLGIMTSKYHLFEVGRGMGAGTEFNP